MLGTPAFLQDIIHESIFQIHIAVPGDRDSLAVAH